MAVEAQDALVANGELKWLDGNVASMDWKEAAAWRWSSRAVHKNWCVIW